MIVAYIMITADIKKIRKIVKQLQSVPEISKIFVTAGEYDIIVRVEVSNLEELHNITQKIHLIDGIIRTTTHVVEKEAKRKE